MTKGELEIREILEENKISYLYDDPYYFNLKTSYGGYARYDFIILENDAPIRLIEFDGRQHYEALEYFGGEQNYNHTVNNDILKNQYSINNNIPLVRIPYTLQGKITYNDLFEDKYLIKYD